MLYRKLCAAKAGLTFHARTETFRAHFIESGCFVMIRCKKDRVAFCILSSFLLERKGWKEMRKIHSLLCLLLAGVVLLSACQKSDPAPKEDTAPKQQEEQQEEETPLEPVESFDPSTYTNAMMLEDYDFFWTTLEENCAPLIALQEVEGIDLEQWKGQYRQKVAALQDGDAEGFVSVMREISQQFGGFAHIYAVDAIVYHRYMDGGSGWESDTQKMLFQSDKVRAFYQWEETLPVFQQQLQSLEQNNEVNEDQSSDSIAQNVNLYRQGDTAVAMIKTFSFYGQDVYTALIQKLQKFCLENLDAQDFIIDITRNSGGNGSIWSEGFAPLWAGKTFTYKQTAAYKSGSVNEKMWGDWPENDPDVKLRSFSDLGPDEFPQMPAALSSLCDGLAEKTVIADYSDTENKNGKKFKGRIWILTDGANASSSEQLVQFAKGNEACTVVGTQTQGMSGTMAPLYNTDAAMPNCGMLVRFNAFYFLNEDGTCNDLEGTHPDIEIESGETAMQRCLKEIEKLQK